MNKPIGNGLEPIIPQSNRLCAATGSFYILPRAPEHITGKHHNSILFGAGTEDIFRRICKLRRAALRRPVSLCSVHGPGHAQQGYPLYLLIGPQTASGYARSDLELQGSVLPGLICGPAGGVPDCTGPDIDPAAGASQGKHFL